MASVTVKMKLPEELVSVLGATGKGISQRAKELLVIELFREEKLSSGKAASLLGMSKFAFIQRLAAAGVPFIDMSKEEFLKDVETASKTATGQ